MAKREAPEVNAGSMADIAFLLLIFFLVTTQIGVDQGIYRLLPRIDDSQQKVDINERNIFRVLVNKDDQLLVEDNLMDLKDLRKEAVKFLENNGDGTCSYCSGEKSPESSDNPDKAVISIMNDGQTSYKAYISVQNELVAAYYELRNRESLRRYGVSFKEIDDFVNDPKNEEDPQLESLKEKASKIKDLFPMRLSEAEPRLTN